MNPNDPNDREQKQLLWQFLLHASEVEEFERQLSSFTGYGNGFDKDGKELHNLDIVNYNHAKMPTECWNYLDIPLVDGNSNLTA